MVQSYNRHAAFAATVAWLFGPLALGACGAAVKPAMRQSAKAPPTTQMARARGPSQAPRPSPPAQATCVPAPVHFAYDSATLDDQARRQLANDAACVEHTKAEVDVTGMTDPRGTEEYNLALGERRADTVAIYLNRLGVERSRLAPRSLGEEYAKGTNDAGWGQDRRAELSLH